MKIIRYTGYSGGDPEPDGFYLRAPEPGEKDGHWVRYEDHARVLSARLQENERLREALQEIAIRHETDTPVTGAIARAALDGSREPQLGASCCTARC